MKKCKICEQESLLFCKDCDNGTLYCKECSAFVHKSSNRKNHYLGDAKNVTESKSYCFNHPSFLLLAICEDCSKVICQECIFGEHYGHKCKKFSAIVEETKHKFYEVLNQFEKEKTNLEKVRSKLHGKRAEINRQIYTYSGMVEQKFVAIADAVIKKKIAINSSIAKKRKGAQIQMKRIETNIDAIDLEIKKTKGKLEVAKDQAIFSDISTKFEEILSININDRIEGMDRLKRYEDEINSVQVEFSTIDFDPLINEIEFYNPEKKTTNLKLELARYIEENKNLKQKIADIEFEHKKKDDSLLIEMLKLEEEVNKYKSDQNELNRQIAELNSAIEQKSKTIYSYSLQIFDLEANIKDFKKKVENLTETLSDAQANLVSTVIELNSKNEELDNTKEELANTKEELANTQTNLDNAREEIVNTKRSLDSANEELANTKGKWINTREELVKTTIILNETKANLDKALGELAKAQENVSKVSSLNCFKNGELYFCKGKSRGCNGYSLNIYGSNPYTSDSNCCAIAIHAGLVGEDGGLFKVIQIGKYSSYVSTMKSGITSRSYDSYDGVVVTNSDGSCFALNGDFRYCKGRGHGCTGYMGSIWGSGPYTSDSNLCGIALHSGSINDNGGIFRCISIGTIPTYEATTKQGITTKSYGSHSGCVVFSGSGTCRCIGGEVFYCSGISKGCTGQTGSLFGNNPYTTDSNYCKAALHSGIVNENGGVFKVTLVGGILSYPSTTNNGITSTSYGSYSGYKISAL